MQLGIIKYAPMNITDHILLQTKNTFEWTYYGDLYYFAAFHHLKSGKESKEVVGDLEFFKQFLIEYRVSRNIATGKKEIAWVKFKELAKEPITIDTVDQMAKHLFNEFHPKKGTPTSLCSKLLMLLKPELIIPIDSINKIALKHNLSQYVGFAEKVKDFKIENSGKIKELIDMVSPRAEKIESIFSKELENLEKIRENKVIDKLLLQIGGTKLKAKELNKLIK